jgi:replication initiation and membrane attachment protein DnaB
MSVSTSPKSGVLTFRVPRLILDNGSLKTLSGDALSLFLLIAHHCYRSRTPEVIRTFRQLFTELDQRAQEITKAAKELRAAGLIHFQQQDSAISFQIAQPDGSKAKSYLQKPSELTKIEVV